MLFTPIAEGAILSSLSRAFPDDPGDSRVKLDISREDRAAWRDLPKPPSPESFIIVTDLQSRRRFVVTRAPCGLGCYCAARIVSEIDSPFGLA